MGDFNIDLLNYHSNTSVSDFITFLLSNNYFPCINHPTRITSQSSTISDNIYTNVLGTEIVSGDILAQISDHCPQFLILKDANMHYAKSDAFKYDYSTFSGRAFLEDFSCMEFSHIDNSTNVERNYNKFVKKLGYALKDMYQLKNVVEKN